MAGKMPGPLRVHTFSSTACVHAVESFDGGSNPPHRSGVTTNDKSTEVKKTVKKLLSPLKQKWRIASRSRSKAAASRDAAISMHNYAVDESDAETFVSANNSRLSSFGTDDGDGDGGDDGDGDGGDDDDDDSELSSFLLTPLIFPVGILEGRPAASPVKVVQKLPFGYVIGRKLDTATAPPPSSSLTLSKKFKKMIPMLADLQLRSRWRTLKKKVVGGPKEIFRRGSPQGKDGRSREGGDDGCHDDEDVFWKKDVRGLRCRRMEDDDPPY